MQCGDDEWETECALFSNSKVMESKNTDLLEYLFIIAIRLLPLLWFCRRKG